MKTRVINGKVEHIRPARFENLKELLEYDDKHMYIA
jgi:hypothetical protein